MGFEIDIKEKQIFFSIFLKYGIEIMKKKEKNLSIYLGLWRPMKWSRIAFKTAFEDKLFLSKSLICIKTKTFVFKMLCSQLERTGCLHIMDLKSAWVGPFV